MKPAIFFDRDGVLNVAPPPGGYVLSPEDLRLEAGAADAVRLARQAGYATMVATNQRCVGVGLITVDTLQAIHQRLQELLCEQGAAPGIDAIYYSADDRNSGSTTRKPAPGMLLQAAADHQLDLSASWMIGDSLKDVGAALAAGVRPILVENPATAAERGDIPYEVRSRTVIVPSIEQAIQHVLGY